MLTQEEAKAAGYALGMSNLALGNDDFMRKTIQEYKGDWARVASRFHGRMGSMAESDEMFDGMMAEVKHWIKVMGKKKVDESFMERWNELKGEQNG